MLKYQLTIPHPKHGAIPRPCHPRDLEAGDQRIQFGCCSALIVIEDSQAELLNISVGVLARPRPQILELAPVDFATLSYVLCGFGIPKYSNSPQWTLPP